VTEGRSLGHAIAEGDGISPVALVTDAQTARRAEANGAEALAVVGDVVGVREATTLPILCYWSSAGPDGVRGADACVVRADEADLAETGECELALWAGDEEQLEDVLERFDPELLLLDGTFESVLDLLADVPAGKLVIAELRETTGAEFDELERAGVDAVIVHPDLHLPLVGEAPPEV
jgi:NAD(P)H-dependent flavin oxidoreductase YrpB (nitropropane dioxygenase family)